MDYVFSKITIVETLVFGLGLWIFPYSTAIIALSVIGYSFHLNSKKSHTKKLSSKTMKATLFRIGSGYSIEEIPIPSFSNNELLVEIKAAALNLVDTKLPLAGIPFYRWFVQPTLGWDFAGIIIDKGSEVTNFNIGDEVYGNAKGGSVQQYSVVRNNDIALKPKNLTFTESASLNVAAATSLQALRHWGDLKGKKILIIGASGGCGGFGVQIAKYLGATVYAVNGSRNNDYVKSLGADHVINYDQAGYLEQLNNANLDLIFDTFGSALDPTQEQKYRAFLKEGGKYVEINAKGGDVLRSILSGALGVNLERKDFHMTMLKPNTADLNLIKNMAEEGKLKTRMKVFNFEKKDVKAAFEELVSGKTTGKIVIDI